MVLEPIKPRVLGLRVIPNVDPQLARDLKLQPNHRAIGLLTCTSDDALYTALDEGTKAADVDVVYGRSFYAGSAHASGPLSGEVIGIFAAADEESVASALTATTRYLDTKAWFYSANDECSLAFFPHVIPSVGRYLAGLAGVEPGTPMAYLIAPPIEAMVALDAALKVADVEMKVFIPPPSETNFAGGFLVGDIYAVQAAAAAFQEKVLEMAALPRVMTPKQELECLTERFGRERAKLAKKGKKPFRILESGLELDSKPSGFTHLFDNRSLVPKNHPAIRFRGKLDLLQAYVLDAQQACIAEGLGDIAKDLGDILDYLRRLLAAEVVGTPVPELVVGGLKADELQKLSHNTKRFLNVGWIMPDASMGAAVVKLNLLRAYSREVEIAAIDAHGGDTHMNPADRDAMIHGLNRISSAIHALVCKRLNRT